LYAVKCLDLGHIGSEKALEQLREEIEILVQLDHPNIVRLEEVYESSNEIYLVFECLTGGELFDRLDEQVDYHYSEKNCAHLAKQMLCAVRYCHSKGIIHRDLKVGEHVRAVVVVVAVAFVVVDVAILTPPCASARELYLCQQRYICQPDHDRLWPIETL